MAEADEVQLHGPARVRSRDELREGLFRLLQRSYTLAARRGGGLEVYRSSAALIHQLCGERWAQETIFPAESVLVRRFLAEAGLEAADPARAVQHSLMANSWISTWAAILMRLERAQFRSLCEVAGEEHLRAALAAGRGTVLAHSHTLFVQLFWTWMKHQDLDPGVSIWRWAWGRKPEEIRDPRVRAIESARELHAAKKALRRGGLVQVLADGLQGSRKIGLPFCNRLRGFETTFAELALDAGAAVVPANVMLAADGRLHIEIGRPFAAPPEDGERSARVRWCLEGYVEHLRRLWREHPSDVSWYQMKRHLDLPRADAGGAPQASSARE